MRMVGVETWMVGVGVSGRQKWSDGCLYGVKLYPSMEFDVEMHYKHKKHF